MVSGKGLQRGAGWACLTCDSATAEQVRAGIFNGDLLSIVGSVLLPLVVLGGIVAWIHGGPWSVRVDGEGSGSRSYDGNAP